MKLYISLITLLVTDRKTSDPSLVLDIDVEDVDDGRDEFDMEVTLAVLVPPGTMLKLALAPQTPVPKPN
jgi:hypothetical protein